MSAAPKQYDQAYFKRWYHGSERSERQRHTARKAALAIAMAEYYLGHPVRTVLDIGCGEGDWRKPLLQLRPQIDYLGLDGSEYAVARYGKRRNLRLLRFGQLAELRFDHSVDLLVCSDVMHYLKPAELKRGLAGFAELGHGVAFIDLFCKGDAAEGDDHDYYPRTAGFYRRHFAAAGLLPVGSHTYLLPSVHAHAVALERA